MSIMNRYRVGVYALVFYIIFSLPILITYGIKTKKYPRRELEKNITWIEENVPDNIPVGSFQTGYLGYMRDNVINLDGKVDVASNKALRKGKLAQYILGKKIPFIVDWPDLMKRFFTENGELKYPLNTSYKTVLRSDSLIVIKYFKEM